mmetsp:Transcript_31557/g.86977  ORF Transcript_31557/g.86977 Transcript_31557/m.86977 type:complete len:281 (+) Transcript_31557:521-1363(+)
MADSDEEQAMTRMIKHRLCEKGREPILVPQLIDLGPHVRSDLHLIPRLGQLARPLLERLLGRRATGLIGLGQFHPDDFLSLPEGAHHREGDVHGLIPRVLVAPPDEGHGLPIPRTPEEPRPPCLGLTLGRLREEALKIGQLFTLGGAFSVIHLGESHGHRRTRLQEASMVLLRVRGAQDEGRPHLPLAKQRRPLARQLVDHFERRRSFLLRAARDRGRPQPKVFHRLRAEALPSVADEASDAPNATKATKPRVYEAPLDVSAHLPAAAALASHRAGETHR